MPRMIRRAGRLCRYEGRSRRLLTEKSRCHPERSTQSSKSEIRTQSSACPERLTVGKKSNGDLVSPASAGEAAKHKVSPLRSTSAKPPRRSGRDDIAECAIFFVYHDSSCCPS